MISNFYMYSPPINRHQCVLFTTQSYVIYSAMGSFVLPSIFMTFLYVKIFAVLHRQSDTLKKSSVTCCESPSQILSNGGVCPTISISATRDDPVSCAVTRDVTASTFMAEDTFMDREDDDDDDDNDDDEDGDKTRHRPRKRHSGYADSEEDDDRDDYSPTRTEFDLGDACVCEEEGGRCEGPRLTNSQARHIAGRETLLGDQTIGKTNKDRLHSDNTSKHRFLGFDIFAQRGNRSNSLQVEMETTFLRASSGGDEGDEGGDGGHSGGARHSLLLPGAAPKRDFLTVSTCDIPLQFRLKKSRSAAFDLQDAGKEREPGRHTTLTVPRSRSASTLCVGTQYRRSRSMQNGTSGGRGHGGHGGHGGSVSAASGLSSLSLHRLSLLWTSRRPHRMTTSMRRRFQLREQRATKRMLLIMACFYVCWVPFTLMYMLRALCSRCPVLDDHVTAAIIWLGYANSSLNPLLYTLFNDDFRKAFKKLLRINRLRRPPS
jgi:hypothetical protein